MIRELRLSCAMMLVAVAFAACAGSSAELGQLAGPGERTTLFGSSVYQGDQTFQEALARQDSAYGRLEALRLFTPGAPVAWPGSPADIADRPVVYSFKLAPREVLSGRHDAELTEWFASLPPGRAIWWVYFHEPEDDVGRGMFTAADFRAAFRHVRELARRAAPASARATLVLQCQTLYPGTGRSLSDYDPGADAYDVLGFDCYNRQVAAGTYPDPHRWLAPALAAAEERGRPLALPEFGSPLVPGDDGSRRAKWLLEVASFAVAHDLAFVAYYDSPITGTDYTLTDLPSRDAWGKVVTGTP